MTERSGLLNDTYNSRIQVPTNEYGIAIPPQISECIGENCIFREEGQDQCEDTQHHLHSTGKHYEEESRKAEGFRELFALTVWIPKCRHKDHHDKHELIVPVPESDVLQIGVREGRRLKKIEAIRREIVSSQRVVERNNISKKEINRVLNKIDNLEQDTQELLISIANIELIPEELVTGALLLCAPEIARARILTGSKVVLTGTVRKEDVPVALETAYRFKAEAKPLQTGVDELQLAA